MRRWTLAAGAVLVLAILAWLLWLALSPRPQDANVLSGYVEGEALYLASPTAGSITALSVSRGQRVAAGAPVFAVDARGQIAERAEALAQLSQARQQSAAAHALVEQTRANLKTAELNAANARRDAERYTRLFLAGAGAVSAQETDKAETAAAEAEAQRRAAAESSKNAEAQAAAAQSAIDHATAGVANVQAHLDQLSARAPAAGRVEETFFQVGEWAGANQPIVSLIPDGKVKLRFYVAERDLAFYPVGRSVRFGCDGCGALREADITYVSPRPEFTPPVIYSRKARERMVFLIEATPRAAAGLSPGQPVDVQPLRRSK